MADKYTKEFIDELVIALRCSNTCDQMGHTRKCIDCGWHKKDAYDARIPIPADIEIDGQKYWVSCGCEELVADAANVIEHLVKFLPKSEQEGWKPCPFFHNVTCHDDTCDGCDVKNWRREGC